MTAQKKGRPAREKDDVEKTIDSYTGEVKRVPEDADEYIEVVPVETDDRDGKNFLLNEETGMDAYVANSESGAAADQAAHFTKDEEIEADFAERQGLAAGGRDVLLEELEEHTSLSPQISGGDLDASWQTGNQAGEETVGGSAPTPDQDTVEELGEAAGLEYRDGEPLDYDKKVLARDRDRWELNPASALDQDDDPLDDEDLEQDDLDELEELDALEDDGGDDLEDDQLDDESDDFDVDLEEEDDSP